MVGYVSLVRFTQQGVRGIRESPQRAQAFVEAAEKAGVKVEGQYWTVGAYDGVLVLAAEDGKKILRCLTDLVSQGGVTTETLEAFDSAGFKAVLGA